MCRHPHPCEVTCAAVGGMRGASLEGHAEAVIGRAAGAAGARVSAPEAGSATASASRGSAGRAGSCFLGTPGHARWRALPSIPWLAFSLVLVGAGGCTVALIPWPQEDAAVSLDSRAAHADVADLDGSSAVHTDAVAAADASCEPVTCASLGHSCGEWPDGCGGTLQCGICTAGTCTGGTCISPPVDCSGIASHPLFELCDSGADFCSGVYTNGEGCAAFCGAAGLLCSERYGGSPGCGFEPQNPILCDAVNGHLSDWCVCRGVAPTPTCSVDPGNPPVLQELHYASASFDNRPAWVLTCRDYAYTAIFAEHEACDSLYEAGHTEGGRAIFTFSAVPQGTYDVYVEGRHTANRNPAGALVTVTSLGQTYTAYIYQRDNAGMVLDLHGRYCLGGSVEVVVDSTVSSASDSVRRIQLSPAP